MFAIPTPEPTLPITPLPMPQLANRSLPLALCALIAFIAARAPRAHAQDRIASALATWLAVPAPPGEEHTITALIARTDPRWRHDDFGNLILRAGSGRPRRAIACAIDAPSLVVSQITDDGYLRLHRAGSLARHALFDQFHEGQQIVVLGARGPVPGVVAIPNGHFSRQHRADTLVVTADDMWVDVGTTSAAETRVLGIALLDPIVRDVPPWTYAGWLAGQNAGGRIGCAAVASAAAGSSPASGETIFIIATQFSSARSGVGAALARVGAVDDVTLVLPAGGRGPSRSGLVPRPSWLPSATTPDSVRELHLPARHAGTLVESVRLEDAVALRETVRDAAAVSAGTGRWIALAAPPAPSTHRRDALAPLAALLDTLVELPGVPMHEHRVRDAVHAALPRWARERATQDSIGNLIVAAGPDRDTVVFIAHLDEVGYIISGIASDGTVSLQGRGGVIPSAWEGQPALVHFDPEPGTSTARPSLPGIFIPRDDPDNRRPPAVRAWFGMDSAALVAAGVRPGLGVTAHKRGLRLGATRFTARSLDDRAGTTALILALRRIDPDRLPHKVMFVWSVAEEGGLVGARAFAERFGASVRRVHAVDTFVSSDTPLESPHFAHAPLGAGPVLRGIDDGMISPREERERILRIARDARIPLQVGTTHGSTDGTVFLRWGAPNTGLSWPGRYSHSPAEVLDLRDLDNLVRIIVEAARARTQ